jgi:peptide/nickel transport system permease protein
MRSHATASSTDQDTPDKGAHGFNYRARGIMRGHARLIVGLSIVATFYVVATLADFVAPYDYGSQSREETLAPATALHFLDAAGSFHARPFIRARRLVDPLTRTYAEDSTHDHPLALFARGYAYDFLGLFKTDRHLFGIVDEEANRQTDRQTSSRAFAPRFNLLGTDKLGRDRFSRLVRAARFSLAVAPLGALFAGALGILVGCVAGYAGRKTDAVLMRAADAMLALPALVLILAARAALPIALPTVRAAAFLIAVFVVVGWAEMARLVRGLVMELRGHEFVTAARSLGMTESRVLFRHVLPNASRAIIVQLSLMVPAFLLAETALSFLGVGVQEPDVSWGTMLADANSTTQLAEQPLLLLAPAFAIFLFVLGVRLLSDGLQRRERD